MYRKNTHTKTTIKQNTSYDGESIEQKIYRIINNKEPIKDGAPLIYTERKNGVEAQYNIRTDRFEIAVEAADAITKTKLTQRQSRIDTLTKKEDGGAEPIQGTK